MIKNIAYLMSLFLSVSACVQQPQGIEVVVTNALDEDRTSEVVTISIDQLKLEEGQSLTDFGVFDELGSQLIVQPVDSDEDGQVDGLLFQPSVKAQSSSTYVLKPIGAINQQVADSTCFARFVPERTDDYAWENDRVAFRTYGPTAQRMIEEDIPGGTLSSGIDCWLKKVDYPIINKWYKANDEEPGAYHKDRGEGLDNFHVGSSRGCGGIAVRDSGAYFISKNFIAWETKAIGPLSTSFDLEYEDWTAGEKVISEVKHISLDKGSNLSKFTIEVGGTAEISAGLTLHENDGEVTINDAYGWVSYWQPHADSYLATALIAAPDAYIGAETYLTDEKDLSNAFMHLKVADGSVTYYTGFAWQESGQFANKEAWENYLTAFAKRLKQPLKVEIKKN
ncbi:DUF4861 domain-containing protein [Reichenbachiella carrageenanivorans]|uniref:DUF4861 domain-containing protein n=1 Tax=Reichenbachiella carrageenanivorans TaxID=2979869 RepID=A0ABY6D5D1_9BACT|nr:DUF4861 domain-containing protein [Reichenbachiella carrageenanivorans]UXX81308.1 DUF4861 domain-containing protein [Reichenbachiella carrageenanivorans]